MPDSILLLLRNSWGEIDWILPLLHRIRDHDPQARIYTIFTCDRFFDERVQFPDLYRLLEQVSTRIFRPLETIGVDTDWEWPRTSEYQLIVERPRRLTAELAALIERTNRYGRELARSAQEGRIGVDEYERRMLELKPVCDQLSDTIDRELEARAAAISEAYFERIFDVELASVEFDLILRDDCLAFDFHRRVHERFPRARVARGCHGFDLTNRSKQDVYEPFLHKAASLRPIVGHGDVWFTCSQNLSDVKQTYWNESKCVNVGFPRLDRWWVDRILETGREYTDSLRLPEGEQRLLWISRQPSDSCFTIDAWRRIHQGIVRVVRERSGVHLIVKPHPRQSIPQLLEVMQELPRDRWTLWRGSTMAAAHASDLVVSVWSSAILDCLAVGKPVIEYFEYEKEAINQARGASGDITGGWRSFGLAVPADRSEDVHALIDLWRSDPEHAVWRDQRAAYLTLHPEHADHTGLAVSAIARLFEPEPSRCVASGKVAPARDAVSS